MQTLVVNATTYRQQIIKLNALEKALVDMLEVGRCKNSCKKNDMTCATRRAERALKIKIN